MSAQQAVTMNELDKRKAAWASETLEPVLKRFPERKKTFRTSSDIPVERVYLPREGAADFDEKIGFPGEYPFTRGVQPTMYRGRFWTMRAKP